MSDAMFEEVNDENSSDLGFVDVYHPKKRSCSRCPSGRRKIYVYLLFACVVTVLIGLNVKFILFLTSENAKKRNVDISQSLVISDGRNLYALEAGSKTPILLQTSKNEIIAFDVYSNETVLWNEYGTPTIRSTSNLYKSVESMDIRRMQALAVDQVNKLLYIIDESTGTLSVFDALRDIQGIMFSDLVRAHDLALDPATGLMFVLQQYDSIFRCDMDGTSRRTIVADPRVSAFTVDRERKLVYYASDSVGVAIVDYDGRGETRLGGILPIRIESLAIFRDQLFWTSINVADANRSELWSCDLLSTAVFCNAARLHEIPLINPRVIKASPLFQTVENPCNSNDGLCDQLCLLASNRSYSCACNMGLYLNPVSGECLEVIRALIYVQGKHIRVKNTIDVTSAFSDILIPKSFYAETLKRKSSIDYAVGPHCFYISDDDSIYIVNETVDGDQKKIFSVGRGRYIRNMEYEFLNDYLYYIVENAIGHRWISILSLLTGEPIQKSKIKSQTSVFLIGAVNSLICSPNWEEIFGKSIGNDLSSDAPSLRYFDMYEMVHLDVTSERIYWIGNASAAKIEYVQYEDALKLVGRGVVDLPITIRHPASLAVSEDSIFVANTTGIWRFDKFDGHGAARITAENQTVSHAKINLYVANNRFVVSRRHSMDETEMEMQIGV